MKLDHIALQVKDPIKAAEWYQENFDAKIIYKDETWSFVEFDNVKLAFVVKNQHPMHIAFEVESFGEDKPKKHRDGSSSVYKRDPFGNIYELIKYKEEK